MKIKLLITAILPFLFWGCDMNDLFDEGDTNKVYDGPTVVGFAPLEQEVNLDDEIGVIEVQLIGEQRSSDLAVNFSVASDNDVTAAAGVHYTLATPSPVTIESGTSTVNIVIELIEDSVPEGEEVKLILHLEGGDEVNASANLDTSTIFIQG